MLPQKLYGQLTAIVSNDTLLVIEQGELSMFIVSSRLGRTFFTAHQETAAVDFLCARHAVGDMAWLEFDRDMY